MISVSLAFTCWFSTTFTSVISPVIFELMPPSFTLSELQGTVEALSGVRLHKQNFRRLVEAQGLVEETGETASNTGGRPARLVRFRREVVLERLTPGVRLPLSRG